MIINRKTDQIMVKFSCMEDNLIMKKRTISIIIAALMLALCFAPAMEIGGRPIVENLYAASDTNKDGTYAGTFPSLPNGIAAKAIEFAWPYGTPSSKYKYKGGEPVGAYAAGLQTAYGSRSRWGAAPKAGASCDVFVGTVVRNSYDTDFPRGLSEQFPYLASSSKFTEINTRSISDMRDGDIIIYKYNGISGGGAHTCIYVTINGKGYVANANYNRTYGIIVKPNNYTTPRHTEFHVYRATGTCNGTLARGQNSTNVKYMQQFLNWAGFDCGTPDGSFGPNTENALKAFQKAVGLNADGKADSQTLAAAKAYKRGKGIASAAKPITKKAYSGKWPTKTVNKKKGSKTNIKRWQAFLKWYGYPMTTGGKFGPATLKYTKAFQKANGLKADGSVGPKTLKKAKTIKKKK
jgi:peptidoglycan hydrolase-like protein with peptidoglycan-binding domain